MQLISRWWPSIQGNIMNHIAHIVTHNQGGPPWPSDAISIESNGISNRSNRNSQKFSNGRKIARMARILTIFGRNRSSRRNLSFQKFSNERKIIESIESIVWSDHQNQRHHLQDTTYEKKNENNRKRRRNNQGDRRSIRSIDRSNRSIRSIR